MENPRKLFASVHGAVTQQQQSIFPWTFAVRSAVGTAAQRDEYQPSKSKK